jgi:hypothetical protein
MKKREKLGSIWVDTASLLIGDPCQLLSSVDSQALTYEDLLKLIFSTRSTKDKKRRSNLFDLGLKSGLSEADAKELMDLSMIVPPNKVVTIENSQGNIGAINYMTDCDGYYPVYVEFRTTGEPARLVIELGGKVRP